MDNYFSKRLKKLAVRQRPPAAGRERLLQAAAGQVDFHDLIPFYHPPKQFLEFHRTSVSSWSIGSFDWSSIYSLNSNFINLRVLL